MIKRLDAELMCTLYTDTFMCQHAAVCSIDHGLNQHKKSDKIFFIFYSSTMKFSKESQTWSIVFSLFAFICVNAVPSSE